MPSVMFDVLVSTSPRHERVQTLSVTARKDPAHVTDVLEGHVESDLIPSSPFYD